MPDITKIKVNGDPESSYQLYPRNEEFAKRAGGNTGSQSGVQPDWNQNDETAADYVKNRPFYTGEPVFTEIIPEQTYTLSPYGNFTIYMDTSGTYPYSLEPDKEYIVTYNGTIHEFTSDNLDGAGAVGDSNPLITGSEPTTPFMIAAGRGILQIIDYTGNTEVTFKIDGYKTEIKQVDLKYIPELPKYMSKDNPVGYGSFSLNRKTDTVIGFNSHAEGVDTTASGTASHSEGDSTTASGEYSHAEGRNTIVSDTEMNVTNFSVEDGLGRYGHAEGFGTVVTGQHGAHAEGCKTLSSGSASHSEGHSTTASGWQSHSEGHSTTASGEQSHSEGHSTTASGDASHAEGYSTTASGEASHAEGYYSNANARFSHAEGCNTTASGEYSHAEGSNTTASGLYSHAEGYETIARGDKQHVQGKYNVEDSSSKYAHIVGNGADSSTPSNAHTLDWNGVPWFKGRPQFGGTAQDQGSQTVMANGDKEIILTSSTADSTKKFKITVDDSGTLTATEITQ